MPPDAVPRGRRFEAYAALDRDGHGCALTGDRADPAGLRPGRQPLRHRRDVDVQPHRHAGPPQYAYVLRRVEGRAGAQRPPYGGDRLAGLHDRVLRDRGHRGADQRSGRPEHPVQLHGGVGAGLPQDGAHDGDLPAGHRGDGGEDEAAARLVGGSGLDSHDAVAADEEL